MSKESEARRLDIRQDVGFCFLKPDYVDIVKDFETDLGEAGIEVAHRRSVVLPESLIDYIYSDSRGEDFYPTMRQELAQRAIEAMVVVRTDERDADRLEAQYVLESLKRGTNGYPNLRMKYHRPEHKVNNETFAAWQSKLLDIDTTEQVTIQLTQQNVFHASDGPHDGIGTLLRLRDSATVGLFDGKVTAGTERVLGRLDEILTRHRGEQDMSKITREWRVIHEMPAENGDYPIRQIYVWLLTSDKKMVIVSKDGEKWQLPGGKPDAGEDAVETAVREVFEETNVDIGPHKERLNFFGEYMLEDHDTVVHPPHYRQVRAWLQMSVPASQIDLSTAGEAVGQRPEDAVRFVKAVPTKDILSFIPWLEHTDEYKALKRNKVIDRADYGV